MAKVELSSGGFESVRFDGIFGPLTRAAVIGVQEKYERAPMPDRRVRAAAAAETPCAVGRSRELDTLLSSHALECALQMS